MPEASGSGVADESDYSIFENKTGLAEDMKFLASMPELCDVTFLVGETREPVCAVKAVLAARSRVFHKMLYQAPSPQRKKEPTSRENKIRLFLKRSSEPLLNLQNAAQQRSGFTQQLAPIQEPNQHHTLIVEEFEPDVFRQLIQYIHTGCVTLQPRTLLGVMNAADYYGLDELRRACAGFVQCCITVDTVCALLASAERYIQYKCTKSLVQKVLEFIDEHGNEVLNLGSFTLLPQHVVCLILAREELRADEFTKFQAALMWSKKYCDSNQNTSLKEVISNFLDYIQFYKIPTNVLMKEVNPLGLVPSEVLINAVAYQADPTSVDPGKLSPHRVRRQGRSMSVQSSLDPYGSHTTLIDTDGSIGSDAGSDQKQHSGKSSAGDQETPREQRQLKIQIELRNQQQRQEQEEEARRQLEEEEKMKKRQEEEELKQQQESTEGLQKDEPREDQELKDQHELKVQQEESKEQQEKASTDQREELKEAEEQKREPEKEQEARQFEEPKNDSQGESQGVESQQKLEPEQGLEEESLESKEQQEELEEEKSRSQEEEEKQSKESLEQKAEDIVQTQTQQPETQPQQELQDQPTEEERPQTEEELRTQQESERRKIRLQLHLEGLRQQLDREEVMLQRQEEALQLAIQKRRYEELEIQRPQQLQLCLEGRKPDAEETVEQQQQRHVERNDARKTEKVRIQVDDSEVRKQEQEQAQQQPSAPVEAVSGFYIRLVVRQEGRANLVWLLKTHMF
ncbi:uncharacterized protein LOC143182839 isoform X2 [Calliopsis andreniformis]|uniref:uncharacterized protein LOC143182839 isoform X2 n=1 Tax=Calliopsis andreniformis TaxID=337506 RepID=UPI003FCCFEA1